MDFVILLDAYRASEAEGQYSVSFGGTLDECRQQTHHDGQTYLVAMSGYVEQSSEAKSLTGPDGSEFPGRIVGLSPRLAAVAITESVHHKRKKTKPRPKRPRKAKRAGGEPKP